MLIAKRVKISCAKLCAEANTAPGKETEGEVFPGGLTMKYKAVKYLKIGSVEYLREDLEHGHFPKCFDYLWSTRRAKHYPYSTHWNHVRTGE
jgi:hypothetical protein